MTFRGHIKNGQIMPDVQIALPEVSVVSIEIVEYERAEPIGDLRDVLLRHAGKGRDLPTDLATWHDHYAHGKPKR